MFERFRRPAKPSRASGAGLGLSIEHGIVELHGGQVAIDDAPEGGTRVICTFPSDGPPAVAAPGDGVDP